MVPNSWNELPLSQIAKVSIGLVTTMTKNYREFGVPLIRNSDIFPNKVRTNKLIYLCDEFASKSEHRKLKSGDIVTVHTGDVGVSAVINTELAGSLGFATLNTRPNKELIDENYLCWFFNSERFINRCIALSTGDGRQNLNLKDFVKMKVSYPPLPEQRKIAQILGAWDKAIATTEQLIATSKQQKKALMQQLLTGKKRLLNPETGHPFEGEWEEVKLGDLGQTFTGLTGKNKDDFGQGLPYIPYVNIFNNAEVDVNSLELVKVSAGERQNTVQYGDVFFTTSSETPEEVGMSSVMLNESLEKIYLNSFCFGFRPHSFDVIAPEFMKYVLRSSHVRRAISVLAQGATRYNLSKAQLMKIVLMHPGVKEQQKIASVLTAADNEIEALEAKLAHFKQEKKALMQQLLTGKKRVKLDEVAA